MKPSKFMFSLSLVFGLLFSTAGFANVQYLLTSAEAVTPDAQGEVLIEVDYDSDDVAVGTTGLGVRIHFDSSKLYWIGFDSIYSDALMGADTTPVADVYDADRDPATDRYINVSWMSLQGRWPAVAPPLNLFNARFGMADRTGITHVNFSASSSPPGYDFDSQAVVVRLGGVGGNLVIRREDRQPVSARTAIPSARERSLEQQVSYPGPQPIKAPAGGIINIPVEYTSSDNNNQLTGLGLRIHFDSSLVSWLDFESVFPTDLLSQDSSPQPDTADFDGDPSTDSFLGIAWASFTGEWPNTALPQHLFDARFQFAQGLAEGITTEINFSASSTAAGYQFSGSSAALMVGPPCNLDVDGNGMADALTDGLLTIRYEFGFSGQTLINGAVANDCTRCTAVEIEAYLGQCSP